MIKLKDLNGYCEKYFFRINDTWNDVRKSQDTDIIFLMPSRKIVYLFFNDVYWRQFLVWGYNNECHNSGISWAPYFSIISSNTRSVSGQSQVIWTYEMCTVTIYLVKAFSSTVGLDVIVCYSSNYPVKLINQMNTKITKQHVLFILWRKP